MPRDMTVAPKKFDKLIGTNPDVIAELEHLTRQNGGLLRPDAVVEAARAEDSPLHDKFEWDDGAAAEKYRLVQARYLINVIIKYVDVGNKKLPTRVFVSLSTDRYKNESGYRALVDVMSNADLKNQLLADAVSTMTHFQERYKSLQELNKVFSVMSHTVKKLSKKIDQNAVDHGLSRASK
jgi:hypothetical protein